MPKVASRYSGLGHLIERTYQQQGRDALGNQGPISAVEAMRYDALGNLVIRRDSANRSTSVISVASTTTRALRYEPPTSKGVSSGRLRAQHSSVQYDTLRYDAAGNTIVRTSGPIGPNGTREDQVHFYDAANRLRVAESRTADVTGGNVGEWTQTYEDYRYDALGRRVLVRTRRECGAPTVRPPCSLAILRRTVWDGAEELYEIQAPGADEDAAWFEADTVLPRRPLYSVSSDDPNPLYGRVAYTHAATLTGLDQPLSLVRIGYADTVSGQSFRAYPAFTIAPHWDWKGHTDLGTSVAGDSAVCEPGGRCTTVPWRHRQYAVALSTRSLFAGWFGTLIEQKEDASGLQYRRNRYVDPSTQRFTQEDPIGLAGGLNLYGFAGGDPVNFSDPFGLCPKKSGGDGKTEGYADCPEGSSGYYANEAANGRGGVTNAVKGAWATLNFDMTAQLPENTVLMEFNLPIGPARGAARLTTTQAADLAKWLGYGKRAKDAPFKSMGQAVYTNGKDFISLDVTMHAGVDATWKLFSRGGKRLGTFNYDLSKWMAP